MLGSVPPFSAEPDVTNVPPLGRPKAPWGYLGILPSLTFPLVVSPLDLLVDRAGIEPATSEVATKLYLDQ